MAVCALLGIVLVFALITLSWSDDSRRIVIAMLVFTSVAFMASATTAIFAAARGTYPRGGGSHSD
jgi:hypothetical protein